MATFSTVLDVDKVLFVYTIDTRQTVQIPDSNVNRYSFVLALICIVKSAVDLYLGIS